MKIRPQIFASVLCGTLVALVGMLVGWQMDAVEVVTAIIGAVFGFLGGVSLKILDSGE